MLLQYFFLFLLASNPAISAQIPTHYNGASKGHFFMPLKPLHHPPPSRRRSLAAERNATLQLHGSIKDYGYYYADIYIGSPPKKFAVIVDTGSSMSYVPCVNCGASCGPNHEDGAFDPSASASASVVGCLDAACSCGNPSCECNPSNQCSYYRSYQEESSSSGVVIRDVFELYDGIPGAYITFGCELKETGMIYDQVADGLLGLGDSPSSLVNQLASNGIIEDEFSLCLGPVQGHGGLILGRVEYPNNMLPSDGLLWTPLIEASQFSSFYNVDIKGLSVGDEDIMVSPSVYKEGYGSVLDSGTTFTLLPTPAFKAVLSEIEAVAEKSGLPKVPGPDPRYVDHCWKNGPAFDDVDNLAPLFPTFSITFNGVDDGGDDIILTVPPINYLFIVEKHPGMYCLGIMENEQEGVLLGGILFRDILVVYNKSDRRVGFAATDCTQLGETMRPPCSAINDPTAQRIASDAGDCTIIDSVQLPPPPPQTENFPPESETHLSPAGAAPPSESKPLNGVTNQFSSVAIALVAVVAVLTLIGFTVAILQPATREKLKRFFMPSRYERLDEEFADMGSKAHWKTQSRVSEVALAPLTNQGPMR